MTRTLRRSALQPLITAAVIICGIVVYDVTGARNMLAPPTSVATVNLNQVLGGLDQRTEVEAGLQKKRDAFLAEKQSREDAIKALRERLEPATGPERESLQEQIVMQQIMFEGWINLQTAEIDIDRTLLVESLFRQIKEAAEEHARAQGYQIVVINDADEQFALNPKSNIPRSAQLREQISSRRILFAENTVDISNDLIARMNNAFNAGQ